MRDKRLEAKMDANQAKVAKEEEMLARLRKDIKSSQAEMISILRTFRPELD
jgi:hypothetical protein